MVEAALEANIAATKEDGADGKFVDAARKLESGLGTAKEKLGTAKEKIGETLERTKTKTKEVGEKVAKKSLADMSEDVGSYVKEHPGQAVLVSFGIGAAIGWLVGRSR